MLAASVGACAPAQAAGAASYDVSPWPGGAPGWKLIDITGKVWSASDTAGRAVLINFWASWCEPCRAEMPSLQELADLHGPRRLLVLAVNFKEPPARVLQFAQTLDLRMPVLLDTDGAAARAWGVNIFPTTLTIDSRGKPRERLRGEVDWSAPEHRQRVSSLFMG